MVLVPFDDIIYWFPGVAPDFLNLLKTSIFILLIFLWTFSAINAKSIVFPPTFAGITLYMVLTSLLTIGILTGINSDLDFFIDLANPIIMIHVLVSLGKNREKIFKPNSANKVFVSNLTRRPLPSMKG